MIGALLSPFTGYLKIGAVVAAVVAVAGAFYWTYSRGASTERAICQAELADKDRKIATAAERARQEQRKIDEAALDTASQDLDAIEAELARERARPPRTIPLPVPGQCPVPGLSQEDIDEINRRD